MCDAKGPAVCAASDVMNSDATRKRKQTHKVTKSNSLNLGDTPWKQAKMSSGPTPDHISFWSQSGKWPQEYFSHATNTTPLVMSSIFARRKSISGLNKKRGSDASSSASSTRTPSDQKPRETKSAPYKHPNYTVILGTKGSYLDDSDLGINPASKMLCATLLSRGQETPQDSLFRDDLFNTTCRKLRDSNETMVIRDIATLIVPSAQTLATYGATDLECLTESVNEGWNSAISVYGPRPQPDYSVGFGRAAFSTELLDKLIPFVGEIAEMCSSYFMSTWQMYFPFLTCEVKCGAQGLDIADRQNAHSMTIAVRAVIELFRLVKRESELDGEILAFSVSHNNRNVRIYGHYAVVGEQTTEFFRHPIDEFDIMRSNGEDKWTSYKFIRNIYDVWAPMHLRRLCSAIDMISPDVIFEVPEPHLANVSASLDTRSILQTSEAGAAA